MKISTAKLTNYWTAKSDPDFIDAEVRLGKHFAGGYVLTVVDAWDGKNAKFRGACVQIDAAVGNRLLRRRDVKC